MRQEVLDRPGHEGAERLFRRHVEGKVVWHSCLALAGGVGLFVAPPAWAWHLDIVLLVYGLAKLLQDVNAGRYAVAMGARHIRLLPAPKHHGSALLAQDLLSISRRRAVFLPLCATWTLIWTVLCLTWHVSPEGAPAWGQHMSLFFGPLGGASIPASLWLVRLPLSGRLAVGGPLCAVAVLGLTGSFISGGALLIATVVGLWLLHRVRLWRLSQPPAPDTPLGFMDHTTALPLEMRPRFVFPQLLTGGGLVVLWCRDGRVMVHPFEPETTEAQAFADLLASLSPSAG